jgi:hypothetical protein
MGLETRETEVSFALAALMLLLGALALAMLWWPSRSAARRA